MIPFVRKYAAVLAVLALSACQARAAGPQDPAAGSLTGRIASDDGTPLAGVVVSDGVRVTQTDAEGMYALNSDKELGYVFVSIPSGYMAAVDATAIPQFFAYTAKPAEESERHDFTLTPVENTRHTLIAATDHHLADRESLDVGQFTAEGGFIDDVKATAAAASSPVYSICMGDMSWDEYWHKHGFMLPDFRRLYARHTFPCPVFNAMGNHDNDFMTTSDYDAAVKYVDCIGPTFYSFNIGQVHYVVMDNIDCSAYDGTDSHNYVKKLSNEQLKWLAKDLAYVDKSTPLLVAMHAQIYKPTSTGFAFDHDSANTEALLAALDGYEVHFVTGHTHKVYNITPDDDVVKGRDIHEHNSGAICASWWWSGNLTPGVHVSIDGAPGGYAIWDIDGTDFAWLYKSTGWPEEYQFRSYDLNNVSFSMDDVPNIPSNVLIQLAYKKYVNAYPENSDNEVLIKIWNWNSNWELSVVDERGKTLEYTPVWAYDPLHIAALSVPRFNNSGITSTPSFVTESATNFFKVKADDADVDLTITVKDEFGHTWTEEMQRPKAFSTDAYKLR